MRAWGLSLLRRPNVAVSLALLCFTLLGGAFRLHGIGFGTWPIRPDGKESALSKFVRGQNNWRHPDEDQIVYRVSALSLKKPVQLDPDFFAYGSLPLYLYRALYERDLYRWEKAKSSQRPSPHPDLYYIGRVVSCLFGIFTIPLVFFMGKRWMGWKEGLVGAALLSVCVFHIQASHFLAVDVMLQFLIGCCLFIMGQLLTSGKLWTYLLAGFLVGISLATKFNAVYLLPVLGLCHLGYLAFSRQLFRLSSLRQWIFLGLAFAMAGFFFFLGQPYAFLRSKGQPKPSAAALSSEPLIQRTLDSVFNPKFMAHIREESEKARNLLRRPVPFMMQYEKTPAYLYQAENWCRAAMGPFLGVSCLAGLFLLVLDKEKRKNPLILLFLAWVLIYFGTTGRFHAKFLRHSLPIYSHLCLAAGYLIVRMASWLGRVLRRPGRIPLAACFSVIFLPTWVYAVAFSALYSKPNTRRAAEEWMREHLLPGQFHLVLEEANWDPIIFPPGINPDMRQAVQSLELNIRDEFSKVDQMATRLAWGNWLLIGSTRQIGSLTHIQERYPITTTYYKLLFSGRLGYDLAHVVSCYPTFLGITFRDDLSDESFTVYDHPKLLFFARTREVSKEETLALLENPPEEVERMRIRDLLLYPPPDWKPPEGLAPVASAGDVTSPAPAVLPVQEPPRSMFEGGQGLGPGRFNEPRDLAVSPQGEVYVADFRNARVQVFDSNGVFLRQWGTPGNGPGQFCDLSSLIVHSSGLVYVTDTFNHRVQVFSQQGEVQGLLTPTLGDGFSAPSGIAEGKNGDIYVCSTANCLIFRFDASGKHISTWGGPGPETGKFDRPLGLAVDNVGQILVVDALHLRIQWFTPEGTFVQSIPVPQWEGEGHIEPYMDLDDLGRIWTTDSRHNRVLVLDPNTGQLVRSIEQDLQMPTGLAKAGSDMLVTDTWNHRIVRIPVQE